MNTITPSKAGYKTSEFWVTMINNFIGLFVLMGWLTPEQKDEFSEAVVSVVGGMMVIIGTIVYIYSRIKVKNGVEESSKSEGVLPLAGQNINLESTGNRYAE